jgi:hypothetical protein
MVLLIIAIVVLTICCAISIVFFERKTREYASRIKNICEEDLKESTEVTLESLDKKNGVRKDRGTCRTIVLAGIMIIAGFTLEQ